MMDRDGVGAMCGITGWVDYGRDLRGQEPVLSQMVATMACRGPDAQGRQAACRGSLERNQGGEMSTRAE